MAKSNLKSGTLRHVITLQERIHERDSYGTATQSWVDHARCYATFEPLSARDIFIARAGQSEVSARCRIRWREGVTADMRVLYRSRIYSVNGVIEDPDSGREWLTLLLSEGMNDG